MRRFMVIWGPPLAGCALASAFTSAAVACLMGHHWILLVPSLVGSIASVGGTIGDIGGIPESGPSLREKALDAYCERCTRKDRALAVVTKERDELHAAVLALALPASPTPDEETKR